MRPKSKKGFTLIELMLSLAIFTLIGLATVRQLSQIQNTKVSAFEDMDLYNDVRAALGILRSDLGQTFHIPLAELGKIIQQQVMRNQPVPHTLFDGRAKELVFTSLSHRNYYSDRRESEQTEISYFLFQRPGTKLPSLMKRESEYIDGDLFQGGTLYRLLDNVESLEFAYWDERQDKWVSDWNSDGSAYLDRFPLQVRIRLSVRDAKNRIFKVENNVKLSFPNNKQGAL